METSLGHFQQYGNSQTETLIQQKLPEVSSPFGGPHLNLSLVTPKTSKSEENIAREKDSEVERELLAQIEQFWSACEAGDVFFVKQILDDCESLFGNAFLVNLVNQQNLSPIELAIRESKLDIMEILINAGASLIFPSGKSALDAAISWNSPHALGKLIQLHDAALAVRTETDEIAAQVLKSNNATNSSNKISNTPLIVDHQSSSTNPRVNQPAKKKNSPKKPPIPRINMKTKKEEKFTPKKLVGLTGM